MEENKRVSLIIESAHLKKRKKIKKAFMIKTGILTRIYGEKSVQFSIPK